MKKARDTWPPDLKRQIAELLIDLADCAAAHDERDEYTDLGERAAKLLDRIGL